ncbi:MAG: alpha/beta hydrolase, partial [Hyphomicrobiales bacterium]|nr:alpha/beta hydrolase [Hyphomicrobiales bacterium]
IAVLRFEFPYMAARRLDGTKRPPPRAEALLPAFAEAVTAATHLADGSPVLIGGKSLGGRVAAMLAGSAHLDPVVVGVVCLGYPFHPPGKPGATRLAPFRDGRHPILICQGERDSFGCRTEVEAYDLPDMIELAWLADGSHDLKPRKSAGISHTDNMKQAAAAVAEFADRLVSGKAPVPPSS